MAKQVMLVTPDAVLLEVARAVPEKLRPSITVIGSLAAGYHLLRDQPELQVRTKDVDCVLIPEVEAVVAVTAVAEDLLSANWKHKAGGEFAQPGSADTPDEALPAIRLEPPTGAHWFIEFLKEPSDPNQPGRQFERVMLSTGHFGIPSFRFTSVAIHDAERTKSGLRCALPDMMALANLLENPRVRPDEIRDSEFDGRRIKRSCKDLGRVLALAWLSDKAIEAWPIWWEEALRNRRPNDWRIHAATLGNGLREMLGNEDDLREAWYTCNTSLLRDVAVTQLRATGERLLEFAVKPTEVAARA